MIRESAAREEKRYEATRWAILSLMAALVILADVRVKADVLDKTMNVGGTTVHYKVVLPKNYDPSKAYPGVLGFGGGPQTMNVVDSVIARNFRDEAEKRGYIVVVPAAPNDQLFFEGGERIFPEFLKQILATYKIRDNKFHIAGPSNGGIASFHVASLNPDYFLSITAFPGYLWQATPEHIQAISKMCINMFVGELDPMGWQPLMQKQAAEFRSKGMTANYAVEKGQPHRLDTLVGPNAGRLFDLFEQASHGCGK
jgi:predicted peptidase